MMWMTIIPLSVDILDIIIQFTTHHCQQSPESATTCTAPLSGAVMSDLAFTAGITSVPPAGIPLELGVSKLDDEVSRTEVV